MKTIKVPMETVKVPMVTVKVPMVTLHVPKIFNQDIIINNKNVDSFVRAPVCGEYKRDKDEIILYNYIVSYEVPVSKLQHVKYAINLVKTERYRTILHETHHWQNNKNSKYSEYMQHANPYQAFSLELLDEISARTAELLFDRPGGMLVNVCQKDVVDSMLNASNDFIYYHFDEYMNHYIEYASQNATNGITTDSELKEHYDWLVELQKQYKADSKVFFDKPFQGVVKAFFTFNGYCILNDKISLSVQKDWDMVRYNLSKIKRKCLSQTSDMIDSILQSNIYNSVR